MIRLSIAALQLSEVFVSSLVHMLYGFYIISTALAGDFSQALNEWIYKPYSNVREVTIDDSKILTSAVDLPPIVLVHGIFGFGKGVCGDFSDFFIYFSWKCCEMYTFSKVNFWVFLIFDVCHVFLHYRNWVGYHILLGQRRRMREFWCQILVH